MEQQPTIVPDGLVGRTIGNYVVRYKLGEGGMGAVCCAEHPSIGTRRTRCAARSDPGP